MTEPKPMTLDQMGEELLKVVRQLKAEGRYHPPSYEELMLTVKQPVGGIKK